MAISLIRNFIAKQIMKKSKGITSVIPDANKVTFAADHLEKRLINMGVDLKSIKSEEQLKQILAYVKQAEDQAFTKRFKDVLKPKADVLDLTGTKIDTSKGIMGGFEVGAKTKTPSPFKKVDLSKYDDAALNALVDEDTILLAEANKLSKAGENYGRVKAIEVRRKEIKEILEAAQDVPPSGYDNFKADIAAKKQTDAQIKTKLDKQNKESIKRFKDKMKDKDPEDLAYGGIAGMLGERTGYFTGALADTRRGKAMSPGTRADYTPGQGHRENVGRPPGGGDPGMTYTAPPVETGMEDVSYIPRNQIEVAKEEIRKKIMKQRRLIEQKQKQKEEDYFFNKELWENLQEYKTLPGQDGFPGRGFPPERNEIPFASKNLLDKFFTDITLKYPDIKLTNQHGYVDKNKAKQVLDKAVLDGTISIGDSFEITRTLDTMGEGVTGINLDTKYLTASGTPEENKYTLGSQFNIGDLGLGYTGNIQGDDLTGQGLKFDYGPVKGEFAKDYVDDSALSKLEYDKTFDLNDLAKLNIKGDISQRSDQDFTTSSLTPKLNLEYPVGSGTLKSNISKNIIEGGTPDLGLGFSYPFAGGEFKADVSGVLSENPNALLSYAYEKGNPYSLDPYFGLNLNLDPISGEKSAFLGVKKKFNKGGRVDKAQGGLAGMLGEPTYADGGRIPYNAGEWVKKKIKPYTKEGRDEFKKEWLDRKDLDMTVEEWNALPLLEKIKIRHREGQAQGGRTGFKLGGIDKARRLFLKLMGAGAAGTVAAKSGLLSILKGGATKSVIKDLTSVPIGNASGMPPWFKLAVNKVIKEGKDVTKKAATKEREIVHRAQIDKDASVDVIQDLETGNVRVEYDSVANLGESTVQLDYKAGEIIQQGSKKGTKTKPEFSAVESEPRVTNWDGDIEFDGENVVNVVDDLLTDTTKLETYATGKNPNIKKLLKSEQKQKKVNKINEDTMEQLDYIEKKTGHTAPESLMDEPLPDDYPFASGGRVPLAGGKGVMSLIQMFLKKKPAKLESLKDFIEKREFILSLIGQGSKQKNKRMLQTILEESENIRKNPEFKFPDAGPGSDIHKEIEMILSKDVTKHASGGRVPMFAGLIAKGGTKLGKFTKSDVLIQMFENTVKQSKSANTKKRFTNFIKEMKAKPELANDPEVWGFFTKGMPKNQRLVVHSDDTVDFWTQSKFGPHNIKTTDKFMQKHPNLSRDQAVKIQNMEPEDQILEMKRLETIADRSRTKNASGGRVSLSAGGLAGMLGE